MDKGQKRPDHIDCRRFQRNLVQTWVDKCKEEGITAPIIFDRNCYLKQDLVSKYDPNDKVPIYDIKESSEDAGYGVFVPIYSPNVDDYNCAVRIVAGNKLEENSDQISKLAWSIGSKVPEIFAKGLDISKREKDIPTFIKMLNHGGVTLLFAKYKEADVRLAILFTLLNPRHRGGLAYLYNIKKFAAITEVTYILLNNC